MAELENRNKAIVLRFNSEVMEKGSIAALNEVIHPDFVNHSAAPGIDPDRQGIINFTINGMHQALTEITVKIHDQVAEYDKVVTRKTIHGTHIGTFMGIPPSGKKVRIEIIDIITLNDGQYMEHWSIRDVQDLKNKASN